MRALRLVVFPSLAIFATGAFAADITATYSCEDGTKLTATFKTPESGPGSVDLTFAATGETLALPQALSADGGRYVSGDTEFWIKGDSGTLTRGTAATTCDVEKT
jgi:membrane-bound inhibitor of C-type lysozyme